jgi:AcrR family transcriptional regulator
VSLIDKSTPKRQRNKRGQGDLLRNDLIAAAVAMVEDNEQLSLRSVARRAGIATTSIYLHFPDLDHLLAAVVDRSFLQLATVAAKAGKKASDPADELRRRCRAYCHFGLKHPHLYQLMFRADIPQAAIVDEPTPTPGQRAFQNLVAAVQRCLETGDAHPPSDPFRLATFIWTAEHGLVSARISRPAFPWPPLDPFINELVDRIMGFPPNDSPR